MILFAFSANCARYCTKVFALFSWNRNLQLKIIWLTTPLYLRFLEDRFKKIRHLKRKHDRNNRLEIHTQQCEMSENSEFTSQRMGLMRCANILNSLFHSFSVILTILKLNKSENSFQTEISWISQLNSSLFRSRRVFKRLFLNMSLNLMINNYLSKKLVTSRKNRFARSNDIEFYAPN